MMMNPGDNVTRMTVSTLIYVNKEMNDEETSKQLQSTYNITNTLYAKLYNSKIYKQVS